MDTLSSNGGQERSRSIGAGISLNSFLLSICLLTPSASSAEFDDAIQPLLKARCVRCHGSIEPKSGLNLSTPAGLARGGESGAAISGSLDTSLLWERISADEMPPDKPLPAAEKDYTEVIKHYPKSKERELALEQKALIRGQQNDNAGMVENFNILLRDYPNSTAAAKAHFWIGRTAYESKDYKTAAEHLAKAREMDKEHYLERASLPLMLSFYYLEEPVGVERPDGVPDRLGGEPDGLPDGRRPGPAGTGEQDLAAADGEAVGRREAPPEGLPLVGRQLPGRKSGRHAVSLRRPAAWQTRRPGPALASTIPPIATRQHRKKLFIK